MVALSQKGVADVAKRGRDADSVTGFPRNLQAPLMALQSPSEISERNIANTCSAECDSRVLGAV